ncbi:PREDICTED: uncharacterized protein LOC105455554 isoform X2 [Wasmannia auropunctata]|nr:PREDICTED: uncharacterized protein LOC105455554 isoform X2 [Wasmannia auropunctata]XP_011697607.1 PREDICTED: uncharacterized protein LOC105455554 isoform X2 [Wasmannia auropunctata]XP_011697689.1 PREDICTED: uncharacterized protein LOC105455554 isoform X2 [Wasmannia auropunctata]XP_011697768.1 PREDICTED: uncharacterized protein LOC105455554 isoform X2 [Wasmannia auropunctata]XP_011697856.1 PREDICTED: uncharacterized protein LOC105455554 isoform X2 [Wasmannia auropunctata]XP_011697936.1 PREDI
MENEIDINIRDYHENRRHFQDDDYNSEQERPRGIDNIKLIRRQANLSNHEDNNEDEQQKRRKIEKISRRLFPSDNNDKQESENNKNFYLEEKRKKMEEAKERYDFDFERGEPVKK